MESQQKDSLGVGPFISSPFLGQRVGPFTWVASCMQMRGNWAPQIKRNSILGFEN